MMIITEKDYVDKAEAAIRSHKSRKDRRNRPIAMVTTSKIRNLLAMASDICAEVQGQKEGQLSDELCGRIDYLKVRFLYEAGREDTVKNFVEDAHILECMNGIKGDKKNFILFSRYMEALVAYHRYLGGKD